MQTSVVISQKSTRKNLMASWALPTLVEAHRILSTHRYLIKHLKLNWEHLRTRTRKPLLEVPLAIHKTTLRSYIHSLQKLSVNPKALSLFKWIQHFQINSSHRQKTLSRRFQRHHSHSNQLIRSTSCSSTWTRHSSTHLQFQGPSLLAREKGKNIMMKYLDCLRLRTVLLLHRKSLSVIRLKWSSIFVLAQRSS